MRLTTVGLIMTLALGLLLAPCAEAQGPVQMRRLGVLSSFSPHPEPARRLEVFRQSLRDLGYVEGQNRTIEYRWAEGHVDRLPTLADELVRLKVEVIVPVGTSAVYAATHATTTIPIVMQAFVDPVGSGLVASLARPGGNITGISTLVPE